VQVDDEFIFGRLLVGQITRLLPAQYAIHVRSRAAEQIGTIGAVKDQSSARNETSVRVDRRQAMPRDRRDRLLDKGTDGQVERDKNAAVMLRRGCCRDALDVGKPANMSDGRLDAERLGS